MKCTIPEISWHNKDPVLSIDIQPKQDDNKTELYRLASGGTDCHVLIWYMTINESGSINLDLAADLTRHQRAVNCVKWSPSGEYLASGDDESVIFIWKLKGEAEVLNILDDTNDQDREFWIALKVLRGHIEDVYDLSWSPNSQFLISGSIDNTAMIWDVQKGKSLAILNDHKGFVQGVAWDPKDQCVATLSADRYLRIFDAQNKKIITRISQSVVPVPVDNALYGKVIRLFHDDTMQTFHRRLCFSPDGKLLIAPAGVIDIDGPPNKSLNTTYIFSTYSLKQPLIVLPSPDQYSVVAKCCPLLFKLRPHNDNNPPVILLPYRMVFAIATKSSVYLYDTQQKLPFGAVSNIHYARLTDLAWSDDGRILIVSSTDGFCSLITFGEDELGELFVQESDENSEDKKLSKHISTGKKSEGDQIVKSQSKDNPTERSRTATQIEPSPIAFRRKPNVHSNVHTEIKSTEPPKNSFVDIKKPTPIAFRRKPKEDNPTYDAPLPMKNITISPEQVIIDKTIISSQEKFESPKKETGPITPISIRRHPRCASITESTKEDETKVEEKFEENEKEFAVNTPTRKTEPITTPKTKSSKKANPIAIRRQPRVLIPAPVEKTAIDEEASDAWPLGKTRLTIKEIVTPILIENEPQPMEVDNTEDIRLVYEESQTTAFESKNSLTVARKTDEAANSIAIHNIPCNVNTSTQSDEIYLSYEDSQNSHEVNKKHGESQLANGYLDKKNPNSMEQVPPQGKSKTNDEKTPRRVQLRTISTPKSLKKLM